MLNLPFIAVSNGRAPLCVPTISLDEHRAIPDTVDTPRSALVRMRSAWRRATNSKARRNAAPAIWSRGLRWPSYSTSIENSIAALGECTGNHKESSIKESRPTSAPVNEFYLSLGFFLRQRGEAIRHITKLEEITSYLETPRFPLLDKHSPHYLFETIVGLQRSHMKPRKS